MRKGRDTEGSNQALGPGFQVTEVKPFRTPTEHVRMYKTEQTSVVDHCLSTQVPCNRKRVQRLKPTTGPCDGTL